MNNFYRKDILSMKDFHREDVELVFQLAQAMETYAYGARCNLLSDKILASLFFQASTRTRLCFESAIQRLGGGVIGFADPKMTRSGDYYQEHLLDTIQMVEGYSDIIVMRHYQTGAPAEAAAIADPPVMNGGDGYGEHPTQGFVDLYTIWKQKGQLDGLRVGVLGDLSQRTIRSFVYGLARWDIDMIGIAPEEMRFTTETAADLEQMGQSYSYVSDVREVVGKLDVLYMMSVIQPSYAKAAESAPGEAQSVPVEFLVNQALLEGSDPGLMVMHPLPRKAELARDVDDLPQAHYIQQANNGVPVRMALMALIFGRTL